MLEGEGEWQVGDQLVRAKPGTFIVHSPGVPHNIGNSSDRPARMFLTVSLARSRTLFRRACEIDRTRWPPDAKAIGELRSRYDTIQLSALKN